MSRPSYAAFPRLHDVSYFNSLMSRNADAFRELEAFYFAKIDVTVMRFYKVLQSDSEDVAIDVMMKIHEDIPKQYLKGTSPTEFQGLIFKIIHDITIDHFRKKLRLNEISYAEAEAFIPGISFQKRILGKNRVVSIGMTSGASVAAEKEIHGWIDLKPCIQKLEEQHQKIIWQICGGLTRKEISQMEGIPLNAVDKRFSRALAEVRKVCGKVKAHARRRRRHRIGTPRVRRRP